MNGITTDEAIRNATASCMRCLIRLGITNAETLKAKVLTTAKKSLDSDAPEASGMPDCGAFFRIAFFQLGDERQAPHKQGQVLAQVERLVDELWDHPDIAAAIRGASPRPASK